MTMLLPYSCPECGLTNESILLFFGDHIMQACGSCSGGKRIFDKRFIPSVDDICAAIAAVQVSQESTLEIGKEINFIPGLRGLNEKMMYWKLYLKVRTYAMAQRAKDADP